MDAKELKERLTTEDIKYLIEHLGGDIYYEDEDKIITTTWLCHGGDSPNKLYYYKESKTFFCHTNCSGTDILSIVCNVKDFTLPEAITYICSTLKIETFKEGFGADTNPYETLEDWSFIRNYKKQHDKLKNKRQTEYKYLNKNTLNMFQEIYMSEWLNDGINKETMKEFNILYSTAKQSIIIPHFDINNNLIGIRQRCLLQEDIDNMGKYSPYMIGNEMYNHALSQNLYGLNVNKETIKRRKKVMIVESEKGVLQVNTMVGSENNFTVALCGCAKISDTQRKLLFDLGVQEVIIGLDRQYKEVGDEDYHSWSKHIREKIINPLLPYFKVCVVWDTEDLLGYKDSPTDKGKDVLLKLMKNKIYIE